MVKGKKMILAVIHTNYVQTLKQTLKEIQYRNPWKIKYMKKTCLSK